MDSELKTGNIFENLQKIYKIILNKIKINFKVLYQNIIPSKSLLFEIVKSFLDKKINL